MRLYTTGTYYAWADPKKLLPHLPEKRLRSDAVVAHLYGLSEKHLVHIFETVHEGWDYDARLRATLKHFHDSKRGKV